MIQLLESKTEMSQWILIIQEILDIQVNIIRNKNEIKYKGKYIKLDKPNGDLDGQDEFDHIGAAIALRLKAMSPEDARQTYVKIFKLVSEEEERLKVLAAKNKK